MSVLSLYAGPTALRRLRAEGLHADQFKVLLAASGGPKWFVLYGMDRYLFSEFLGHSHQTLHTLGSSAGAWRLSCLASGNPLRAIEALARGYSEQTYSDTPSVAEITQKMRQMLAGVLGANGASEIVNNKQISTHIVADRCKGFGSIANRYSQLGFLGLSAAANMISRHALSFFFQRTLFTPDVENSPWRAVSDIDTDMVRLTEENLLDVLIATGSIPFVLEGVRDIAGAKPGLYWDGGITDYHFDMPFYPGEDLVLYPHFSANIVPGWFDKHLPWRIPHGANFDNVVLLTPSNEFVATLPNGKIPDRMDFERYSEADRLTIWKQVLDRSRILGDALQRLVETGEGLDNVQPLDWLKA